MRSGDEAYLELRGREVNASFQHSMKEAGIHTRIAAFCIRQIPDASLIEEDCEHAACICAMDSAVP